VGCNVDIIDIINDFEAKQATIAFTISSLKELFQHESELWQKLQSLDINIITNDQVMNFLADSLQMVNNLEQLHSFDLKDIQRIYQLLVKFHPDNIQYQLDHILFVDNILGDEKEVLNLTKTAIKLLDEKRREFEALLNS